MTNSEGGALSAGYLFRSAYAPGLHNQVFDLVVDLRYPAEWQAEGSAWPAGWPSPILRLMPDELGQAPHFDVLAAALEGEAATRSLYRQIYRDLVRREDYGRLFARALKLIATERRRVLVHCAAGKDRTGILIALLLAALGMGRDDILIDYALTRNDPTLSALRPGIQAMAEGSGLDLDERAIDRVLSSSPDYLEAALDQIEQDHGSIQAYFQHHGASDDDIATFRRIWLSA